MKNMQQFAKTAGMVPARFKIIEEEQYQRMQIDEQEPRLDMKNDHQLYDPALQVDSKRQPTTPRRTNQLKSKVVENRNFTANSKSYQQKSKSGRMHAPGDSEYANR